MKSKFFSRTFIFSILLSLMLFCSITANAETSRACGDNLTWKLVNGTLTISGTGEMYDYEYYEDPPWFESRESIYAINIPNGVTYIGINAFNNCTSLESVNIPGSVTSIGRDAFYNCTNLTSVTIPKSVTSIDSGAFDFCTSLTSVYISDMAAWCNIEFTDYTGNPLYYATDLYLNGEWIIDLVIPNSITTIGSNTFYHFKGFTSISIPNSVTAIGNYAFYGCSGLKSITIPDSVTSIGRHAFHYCSALTSVTIPDSVTSIGSSAFRYCDSLTKVIITDISAWLALDFPNEYANPLSYANKLYLNNELVTDLHINNVTDISNYAFYNCESLTSVTISNGVKSIGNYAFYKCKSLTSVTIHDGVTNIGDYAFGGCTELANVIISDSVTSLGYGAFISGCENKTVYYSGTENQWKNISDAGGNSSIIKIYYMSKKCSYTTTTITSGNGYKTYQVSLTDIPSGTAVILACYKGGVLTHMEAQTVNSESAMDFMVSDSTEYDTVKVFAWTDLGSEPVAEPEII